jgi:hypothetical protein
MPFKSADGLRIELVNTSVDSADTSEAMMMARVSSFTARGLPCGKCSEFSGSYLADNVHRQWIVQNRRATDSSEP